MTECKINFTQESNPLAYGIYQDLLGTGVSCNEMDYGYNVTNYAGLYCPDKDARSCVKGKGDGVVEADEVLEYALDKEYETDPKKYEQYRKIVEGRLGEPLPYVLDDLDPATTFDAEIRAKVQATINELKKIILSQGITEGSEKYNEMMAAGLTWFVAVPDKATIEKKLQSPHWKMVVERIEDDGLGEFIEYLKANGGIRVEGDYSKEYTALEALRNREGECTEISKILFAVMKMAGLRPVFIYENLLKEEAKDPIIKEAIEYLSSDKGLDHACIGFYIGKRIRLFDPMFMNSNADYRLNIPLSLRQYLSLEYINRGETLRIKGELDRAIAYFTRAIEIDPKFADAHNNRCVVWIKKGELDKAMADLTMAIKIDPKFALAYNNRGVALKAKGELDNAIADYTRAIEIDQEFALAYNNRGLVLEIKGEFDKAIADMAKAATLDHVLYYKDLLGATKEKWQSSEELKNTVGLFRDEMGGANISAYEAQFALAYALWELKGHDEAKKALEDALKYLDFKKKPSKPIADFFKDMLTLMPAQMKKDKGVQEIVRSLREKMK